MGPAVRVVAVVMAGPCRLARQIQPEAFAQGRRIEASAAGDVPARRWRAQRDEAAGQHPATSSPQAARGGLRYDRQHRPLPAATCCNQARLAPQASAPPGRILSVTVSFCRLPIERPA